MKSASPRAVVTARIAPQHADRLRRIADDNASTVSRTVARIIDQALGDGQARHQDLVADRDLEAAGGLGQRAS